MNKFLFLQVACYCLQKLKFDYSKLTVNNLKTIFTEDLKCEINFLLNWFYVFGKKKTFGRINYLRLLWKSPRNFITFDNVTALTTSPRL